jgi:hypothetical protein
MHLLDKIGRILLARSLEKGRNWGCCGWTRLTGREEDG